VEDEVILDDRRIERSEAHRIAAPGLALVPEGRQVFPELTIYDNLELGANTRNNVDYAAEIGALLKRFPRLRDRLKSRAGLLSGGEQQMAHHGFAGRPDGGAGPAFPIAAPAGPAP
jgi:ABC-type branched-subunit amino acid transport system ATPase component